MRPTLIGLHGYTMNAGLMRTACAAALASLAEHVDLVYLDAPHACTPEAVQNAYESWRVAPPPPPHLSWWRASDDGRVYEGWERAAERVREAIAEGAPVGLLGFSQGAMLTATLAAMSARGAFPALQFVVLVAGSLPRAEALQPLFDAPVAVPSLHVWGQRDQRAMTYSPKLLDAFDPATRASHVWRGPHVVPPGGEPARAIGDFVRAQLAIA